MTAQASYDYFTGTWRTVQPNGNQPSHPKGVHEWEYHPNLQVYECSICGEPGPYVGDLVHNVQPVSCVWVALVTYTKTRAVQIRSNAAVQPLGQGVGRAGIFAAAPQVTTEETMAAEIIAVCPNRGFAEIASEAHQRAHPELANLAVWSISEHQVGLPEIVENGPALPQTHTCIGPGCTTELRGQDARCPQCQKAFYDECRAADPFFAQTMEEAAAERDRLARRAP